MGTTIWTRDTAQNMWYGTLCGCALADHDVQLDTVVAKNKCSERKDKGIDSVATTKSSLIQRHP